MKPASFSERSAGEAFRRAFPDLPTNVEEAKTHRFQLSRNDARAALDELEPYFQAIESLYSGETDTAQPGTENEVWGYFDPHSATVGIRDQDAIGLDVHRTAIEHVLRTVKSLGLYAHRIVVQDSLLGWLREYADPPELRVRSDAWLLSGISFQVAMYFAILPFLDEEVVLPFAPGKASLRSTDERVFTKQSQKSELVDRIERYVETAHPREEILADSRAWKGGPVFTGTQGGMLFSEQKDVRILIGSILDYALESSERYPRLTVAWTSPKLARMHRYVLEFISASATTRELDRPFVLTELSTNGAIRPDLISPSDALAIRESEEVFLDWRDLVEDCISELKDSYEKGVRRELLLKKIVEERERAWREKFRSVAAKSNFFNRIINPRTSFLTSLCVGTGYAVIAKGDPLHDALVAGGAAATRDAIFLIAAVLSGGRARASTSALRSHFMAFGSRAAIQGR